jgi:hypothetical protein
MADEPLPQFKSGGPTHRMIVVLAAGVAAALFAAGLAISAAYDRTQKDRARRASASTSAVSVSAPVAASASTREIEFELQQAP